ncbi:MAG: polyketide synthase-like protein [Polaromonas sp.]|nr:polyketide synthase-like protein [Polaromonas sp.]
MDDSTHDFEPGSVAIVGLAGRFPAARSAPELWNLLRDGQEATQWMTDEELRTAGVAQADMDDPQYVRASLVLPDMEMFDAEFFGFSKRDAAILDPQHRHFLECAWEALEDAGHMPENFPGAIGVFGGCGMQAYLPFNLLTNPQLVKSVGMFLLRHTGNDKDFLTSRVSYLLDLKGPSISIQTACSTSLVAVHVAAQSLLSGECDMALAGGVSIELPHRRGYHYAEGEILSPDGHCRAFDNNAKGTVFGSGAGIVVLRRLEDAIKDRDNIYAVIRGSAVNNDGSGKAGYLAPSVDGQARAAVEALAVAGVEAASVSYIEAHGTGTPVGDPIEVAALSQAYGGGGKGFCGIGSLKTNIGHLDTAAGVASLIKVSLALRNRLIPASLNFSEPNSRFDMGKTPFYVVDKAKPWPEANSPRRAAVNALGVGGTNAHVILQEPPAMATAAPDAGWQVFNFSARNPASLEKLKEKWCDFLASPPEGFRLADAAYTTQVGRKSFDHRCAIVAQDVAGLRTALLPKPNARSVTGKAAANPPGVVLMFPGGGAHYPGAGSELLSQPGFRQAVDECFSLIPPSAPPDLRAVMFNSGLSTVDAASAMEKPSYAIPALFILEYALGKLWKSWGVTPAAVIGHSAGEYAAACLADVMSVEDALAMVVLRGQLFETAPQGSMLSVDLSEEELRTLVTGLDVDVAAVNAPDLCIASGSLASIAQVEQRLADQGLEGRRLRINVAAHSRLLDGILQTFRERVSRIRFNPPTLPFISNLTGSWADAKTLTDPEYWVKHLRNPVRFADGFQKLLQLAPDLVFIEAGPSQGLCALARQNSRGEPRAILASTCKAQEPSADLALMLTAAGALWTRGVLPKWEVVRGPVQARRISLPTYAFDHQRHWIEPGVSIHASSAEARETLPPRAQALKRLASYDDWFLTPRWRRTPSPAATVRSGGQSLVFGHDTQMARNVVAELTAGGGKVTLVRPGKNFARLSDGNFTLAPADADGYRSLFDALEQEGRSPESIIHLWALEAVQGTKGQANAEQMLAFGSLVHTAKAIQAVDLAHPIHLTIATASCQSVLGEPVLHPEGALALGPSRVIPREIANVTACLIDFADADVLAGTCARAVVSESQSPDETDLVAYRNGERYIAQLSKAAASPASSLPPRLRHEGVYLVSGGLGDIALDLAAFLSTTKKARLALVSRRALPPKAAWQALALSQEFSPEAQIVRRLMEFETQGAQIQVFSADVADPAAMARVVADCQRHFGAINGVFHAAGTLEDALIASKTPESIERVFMPKVHGAQVLHALFPPGTLDLFAVFSSTSAYLGVAGQVDYAAANAYLTSLAASRPDGLSIQWGVWSDMGMAARAYGKATPALNRLKAIHPLLGVQVARENGAVFEAVYATNSLWVLQEHRVAGRPVLPGTAYVEIVRAAMAFLHPGTAIEIRALSFEEAMMFEQDVTRTVRTEMRLSREGYDFCVLSRSSSDKQWLEHARASVSVFRGSLQALPFLPAGQWRQGEIPQEQAVAFGPRWHSIASMQLTERGGTAEMELAERFADDLGEYSCHPALTDMAATFGLHILEVKHRQDNLFVPLSIERIRLVAPVPRKLISRVALKGQPQERFAAFDVSLHAPDGSPVATFEGFSLRGVHPAAISHQPAVQAPKELTLAESLLSCGIRGEDSPALFERIFASTERELSVSSIAMSELKRAMKEAAPKPVAAKSVKAGAASGGVALNPVERAIADVWCELLGVDEVAKDDDFFALGGHSLAAVRLFARIRKQFSVDLPLATLFQAPTLAALAALVEESRAPDLQPGAGSDAVQASASSQGKMPLKRAWSPLVTICQGLPGRRPLFLVHGAGGNVLNFKLISDQLGPEQPFYGLQAQGVDGRLPVLPTIEAMATQYVEAVRSVDPQGPYQLAGFSGGGVIAFEMAQQLTRAGATIEFLGMMDTLSPAAAKRKIPFLKRLWLLQHRSPNFVAERSERRQKKRLEPVIAEQVREKILAGVPLTPELVDFHLSRNYLEAQDRYEPQPYDGSLVLFKATHASTQYLSAGRSLGWEEHIHGNIRVIPVEGSHLSMMMMPGVAQLIDGFRKELALIEAVKAFRSEQLIAAKPENTGSGINGKLSTA